MIQLAKGKGHDSQDTRQMVGLAAVQLGVSKRVVAIDLTADGHNKEQNLQVVINPDITYYSDEKVNGREGCWSCGNICGAVMRAKEVTLKGYDQNGIPVNLELTDFVARIAQHEVDHLDGIRFPDRIPENRPEQLHWVEPVQFEDYRQNWMHWSVLCPRKKWDEMKLNVKLR
jgi:peptide deformylase